MDWAFATFGVSAALDTTQPISELPVRYATEADTVMLYPVDDMMTLLPREGGAAVTEQTFDLPESLAPPITQGGCRRHRYAVDRRRGGRHSRTDRGQHDLPATRSCTRWPA